MLSKSEYKNLTYNIYLTRENLEQEDNALEHLLVIIIELKKECGKFHPFVNSCLRAFQRLSDLLSPYDFYEAGKRLYTVDAHSSVYARACYLEEVKDKPYVKSFRSTIEDYRSFFITITKRKELVDQFFIEYDRLYGPVFNEQFFDYGFQVAKILYRRK